MNYRPSTAGKNAYRVSLTASLLADIEDRFVEIADQLGVLYGLLSPKFEKFLQHQSFSPEYVVSISGLSDPCQYGLPFVDAADVVLFHHGTIDMEHCTWKQRSCCSQLSLRCHRSSTVLPLTVQVSCSSVVAVILPVPLLSLPRR